MEIISSEEHRARDLFYALWVPDLFMKRLNNNGEWPLFCPNEAPSLSDCWGEEFEELYTRYERELTTKGKAIDLDDMKFHQCMRLARFENDKTISFILPDGSFDLMAYRLSTQVKPLIWMEAKVERNSRSHIEIMVKARSQFKERSTATNVEIELPVPVDATTPNMRTSMGSTAYAPENDALLWKIKFFPGGKV